MSSLAHDHCVRADAFLRALPPGPANEHALTVLGMSALQIVDACIATAPELKSVLCSVSAPLRAADGTSVDGDGFATVCARIVAVHAAVARVLAVQGHEAPGVTIALVAIPEHQAAGNRAGVITALVLSTRLLLHSLQTLVDPCDQAMAA